MAAEGKGKLVTPLKKARGLGAAHVGADHWIGYRLGALALVPLSIWFVYGVVSHIGAGHAAVVEWLRSPVNAVLMLLTLFVTFHHAAYGMQEVYEDYIPGKMTRLLVIAATKAIAVLLAAASAFAVLKIALAS
jgi:succinate dehydrogenase / fumarate reductase membrane anchor subunit